MGQTDPTGAQSPQPPPKAVPFGKYLLLDRIAVGGMAEVYTTKSFGIEGFEKIIAVKRILPTMAEDNDFISMFIDEAKIAGHLTHANIVPIYELGKIGESHYIAMEYVWGKDLLQIMNRFRRMRRHMPPVMAAWIASKMLEGLDYAHRKRDRHGRPMGIIHRDVSPQNCLVSYEGQVKLIDFGIAKAASRNTKTQAGVLKGKFGYMSPEQVRGNLVDHRSDIFAASTCLHEMLTGERLFVGESDFSTLEKVRNAEVVPPSRTLAEMPPELEEILMKGLAREPEQRWQTAGEMQEALQRFIALSRPPFGTSKLNTWMRTAFAPEIAKEKGRLDLFAKVGHPANEPSQPRVNVPAPMAARSAAAPVVAPPKKVASLDDFADMGDLGDDGEGDLGGEATMITSSPFEAMQAGEGSSEEINEQPTQIFFTAEEVQDAPGPMAPMAPQAPIMAPMMPPPPAGGFMPQPQPAVAVMAAQVRPVGMAPPMQAAGPAPVNEPYRPTVQLPPMEGGFEPPPPPQNYPQHQHPMGPLFAPPPPSGSPHHRGLETVEVASQHQMRPAERRKKSNTGLIFALLGVAAMLVLGLSLGGAYYMWGRPRTGTISVRVEPESADARVYVDGVQRGRAPLLLEPVPEGEHEIRISAEGFQERTREVNVPSGGRSELEILLRAGSPATTPTPTVAPVVAPPVAPTPPIAAPPPTPTVATAPPVVAPQPPVVQPTAPTPQPTPEPTKVATRTPREERGGGQGYLMIQTIPWARIFLDGRDTGQNTPVRQMRVRAGEHTIGLRTSDGTMHTVRVTVRAGETERVVRTL